MARITAALAYRKLGNKPRAEQLLLANVAEAGDVKKGEYFADLVTGKKWDARCMSLQWLYIFSRSDGDAASQQAYGETISREYPELQKELAALAARNESH